MKRARGGAKVKGNKGPVNGLAEAEQLCMLQQSALDRISMDFQHLKALIERVVMLADTERRNGAEGGNFAALLHRLREIIAANHRTPCTTRELAPLPVAATSITCDDDDMELAEGEVICVSDSPELQMAQLWRTSSGAQLKGGHGPGQISKRWTAPKIGLLANEFHCGRLGREAWGGISSHHLMAVVRHLPSRAGRAPADRVFSHFSKGPQALLASYERRRVKGDRDPLLLDWMQGWAMSLLEENYNAANISQRITDQVLGQQATSASPAHGVVSAELSEPSFPSLALLAGSAECATQAPTSWNTPGIPHRSQQAAVTSPADRALLVVAGAGSGKTKTLLARVRWLVASGQVTQANEILLLSFSRAACDELRQRLRALDRGLSAAVKVKTFHSFALDLFRSHRQALLCESVQGLLPGRLLRVLQHDENLRVVGEWEGA
ncbi:unnamed protein product [Cladocopium goreaui]|uniref:DNA helicase IV (75 kDa helicase) (DNA 3'-5 ' helicase IV) n=1 Tax=Cladocopium goreaui TaxID=2562237 RepID=A0A9P1GQY4_9DINO|nr:unnamed protein product [Cladocopium goreaui]